MAWDQTKNTGTALVAVGTNNGKAIDAPPVTVAEFSNGDSPYAVSTTSVPTSVAARETVFRLHTTTDIHVKAGVGAQVATTSHMRYPAGTHFITLPAGWGLAFIRNSADSIVYLEPCAMR